MEDLSTEYCYTTAEPTWANHYLWGPLQNIVESEKNSDTRIFELGCGSGATANMLHQMGYSVTAIDASKSGIEVAKNNYPNVTFDEASAYDDLVKKYGVYPCVVSLEVVEHCFWPRKYAKTIYDLLSPKGVAIISTPYHGYLKNLALALTGKLDSHWTALWDGGHIKFWSPKTLRVLLLEAGFNSVDFIRVGRIPPFAKSMIAIARK